MSDRSAGVCVCVKTRVWTLLYVNKRPKNSAVMLRTRLFVSTFKIGCTMYILLNHHVSYAHIF